MRLLEVLASVVLGECEKVSRTENILLPNKKKKPVCRHFKSPTTYYTPLLYGFVVCVCVCVLYSSLISMQKNKCPEFSYWYSLLVNVYHARNLFTNVEDLTVYTF